MFCKQVVESFLYPEPMILSPAPQGILMNVSKQFQKITINLDKDAFIAPPDKILLSYFRPSYRAIVNITYP